MWLHMLAGQRAAAHCPKQYAAPAAADSATVRLATVNWILAFAAMTTVPTHKKALS
jgi:hypothetical protein